MSCTLKRNAEGKIVDVLTPQGVSSEFFKDLHGNIFMGPVETSVQALLPMYEVEGVIDVSNPDAYSTGEPRLKYQDSTGNTFENLGEALYKYETGKLTAGYVNPKSKTFVPVVAFDPQGGPSSKFLTSQVHEGTLSPQRVLGLDGVTRFQGAGVYTDTKVGTAHIFKINAKTTLAAGNVKINPEDGTIEMELPNNFFVGEKGAQTELIALDEIPTRADEFDNASELRLAHNIVTGKTQPFQRTSSTGTANTVDEVYKSLMTFLENMGFSVTTLESYKKRYNTIYGKDPDINAIADIANRVVAFSNGQISIEDLSEEVAHIAIEAYSDQNSIIEALATAHLTPEYAQFSEYYRAKYKPFFEGVELEDQVRKEILGKILAKEFTNRFQTEGRTETELSLIEKLQSYWNAFINSLKSRLRPSHTTRLNDLNRQIVDAVMQEDFTGFKRDLSSSHAFFYSAMSKSHQNILKATRNAKSVLENTLRAESKTNPDKFALEKVATEMGDWNLIESANTIVGIVDRKVSELDRAINSLKEGDMLTVSDENIAIQLKESLIPNVKEILASLQSFMKDSETTDPVARKKMEQTIGLITESIDSIVNKEARIQSLVRQNYDIRAKRAFDEAFRPDQMSEADYNREKQRFDGHMKDYGVFGKLFGLMTESSNPVLQLIALKVQQMNTAIRTQFLRQAKPFLEDIFKNGRQKYETSIIARDSAGKTTHYIWGPKKYWLYDQMQEEFIVNTLSKITGKSIEEIKTQRLKESVTEILGNDDAKVQDFTNQMQDWSESKKIRQFKPEYYKDKEEKFKKHNISTATQETMKNFSARSAEIMRPYAEDGKVDKSRMTPAEKEALNRIKQEKAMLKNPMDQFNNIREGLVVVKAGNLTPSQKNQLTFELPENYSGDVVVMAEGFNLETLPMDSRISLDMNNLALAYLSENTGGNSGAGASAAFLSKVKSLEAQAAKGEISYQEVFNWVADNSTLGFSDSYYDSIGEVETYEDLVQEYISTVEDPLEATKLRDTLTRIQQLSRNRRYLLKQNKRLGTTSETNVHSMGEKTRLRLLEIEAELSTLRNRIALPESYRERSQSTSEGRISQDFYTMAAEAGATEAGEYYDFGLKHMTPGNRVRTENFAQELEELLYGRRGSMDSFAENFVEKLFEDGILTDDMSKEQVLALTKDEYAKRNLAAYFKVFEPSGYQATIDKMKSGEISLSEFLEQESQGVSDTPVKINPDYTWTEAIEASEYINPDYKKGDYHHQLSEEFDDNEWFAHYGISKEDYKAQASDDISTLTATKNVEEFEFLKAYMKIRSAAIENYGDKDRVNKWQRVQISKSSLEKVTSISTVTNPRAVLQDWAKDFVSDRIDEKVFGDPENVEYTQEGVRTLVRAIPKYFQAKLEDPSMVSENSLSSVLLDLKESLVYAERQKAEKDIRALTYQIENQNFIQAGASMLGKVRTRPGQVSNMYAKAREYADHHLYGIQQSRPLHFTAFGRELSLTRMIASVQKFSSFSNLGFNLFVDLTGATTGVLNNAIDRLTGEYYHSSSTNRANRQATTLVPGYIAELGKIEKTTPMSQIMELLGIDDPAERVKESKAGRGKRLLKDSGYLFSKLSNLAISPKIALTTLNDFRNVNGEFMPYETFVARMKHQDPNITTKDITTKWKNLENESLYDHLDFTKGFATFNDKYQALYGENAQEMFLQHITAVSAKAQKIVMNVDGVLNDVDRVAAQRDVITNTLMQHRGWMIINLSRRFKGQFYNVSTGRTEEGHYRTVLNLMGEMLKSVQGKGNVAQMYQQFERYQRKNVNRVAIESAVFFLLLVLGEAVLAGDDEDDTMAENLFQLIYLRTVSEYNSATALGIPGSLVEASTSPVPSMSSYKFLQVLSWLPEATELDSEGNNKMWKKIKKATVLRRLDQYSDLQVQIDAYRFYNDPTLFNLGGVRDKSEDQQPTDNNPYNAAKIK
jgi:hypothetical protein